MKNKAGPPVRREDFLEREEETKELWHRAERGHVLMLAPRRVGKTSLLYHMEDAPRADWNCLFLSTEALDSEAQFVARLLETASAGRSDHAWKERFEVGFRQFLKALGPAKAGPVDVNVGQVLQTEWRDIGTIALKAMQGLPGNTLILVDEFPIFIRNLLGSGKNPEGTQRARSFLNWFRETRNAQGNGTGRVHFILTGSLGLDMVVREVGLSVTINDLDTFTLGPLSEGQARKLLQCLSEGEDLPLPEAVRARMLKYIDWPVPFYLQLLFREVLSRVKFRGAVLDERLVDEVYKSLLGPQMVKHFDHWKERLDDPLLPLQARALRRALLEGACKDRNGLSRSSIVQIWKKVAPNEDVDEVLLGLNHDGYLTLKGSRWLFTSSLLRDWWRKWQVKEGPS
jgi:hypothetical protein